MGQNQSKDHQGANNFREEETADGYSQFIPANFDFQSEPPVMPVHLSHCLLNQANDDSMADASTLHNAKFSKNFETVKPYYEDAYTRRSLAIPSHVVL